MLILLIFTWHSWIWFWLSEVCDWAIETVVAIEVTGTSASIGCKLFPKGIVPQVCRDRAETVCPRYPQILWHHEALDPFRLSWYVSLAISAAWFITVSMSLKTWHWFTSYPRQFATLFPIPNQYTAVSVRKQLCRVICKGAISRCEAFYWRHFYQSTL